MSTKLSQALESVLAGFEAMKARADADAEKLTHLQAENDDLKQRLVVVEEHFDEGFGSVADKLKTMAGDAPEPEAEPAPVAEADEEPEEAAPEAEAPVKTEAPMPLRSVI